jgi:hypothetical protein
MRPEDATVNVPFVYVPDATPLFVIVKTVELPVTVLVTFPDPVSENTELRLPLMVMVMVDDPDTTALSAPPTTVRFVPIVSPCHWPVPVA